MLAEVPNQCSLTVTRDDINGFFRPREPQDLTFRADVDARRLLQAQQCTWHHLPTSSQQATNAVIDRLLYTISPLMAWSRSTCSQMLAIGRVCVQSSPQTRIQSPSSTARGISLRKRSSRCTRPERERERERERETERASIRARVCVVYSILQKIFKRTRKYNLNAF